MSQNTQKSVIPSDVGDLKILPKDVIGRIFELTGFEPSLLQVNREFHTIIHTIPSHKDRIFLPMLQQKCSLLLTCLALNKPRIKPSENEEHIDIMYKLLLRRPFDGFEDLNTILESGIQLMDGMINSILTEIDILCSQYITKFEPSKCNDDDAKSEEISLHWSNVIDQHSEYYKRCEMQLIFAENIKKFIQEWCHRLRKLTDALDRTRVLLNTAN